MTAPIERHHRFRQARPDDVSAMFALAKVADENGRLSQAEIRRCLKEHAEGQWVLEGEGGIVAAIFSQRVAGLDALDGAQTRALASLHDAGGAVVLILAWAVDPAAAPSVRHELLEQALAAYRAAPGVERIVAVAACEGLALPGDDAPEDAALHADLGRMLGLEGTQGVRILRRMVGYRAKTASHQGTGLLIDCTHAGQPVAAAGPHLFVLSAANVERLRAYAEKVLGWLDRGLPEDAFRDAIYTWQIGRTAMKQRLALEVVDKDDLRERLQQWLTGTPVLPGTWSTDTAATASGEPAASTGTAALAATWTGGGDVDWKSLYAADVRRPRRIGLPTYPFAPVRHWFVADADVAPVVSMPAAPASAESDIVRPTTLRLVPVWEAHPLEADAAAASNDAPVRHVVLVCGFAQIDHEALEQALPGAECRRLPTPVADDGRAYVDMVQAALEAVRESCADRRDGWVLIQVLVEDEREAWGVGGLAGLLRTAAEEYTDCIGQLVFSNADTVPALARQLADETRHGNIEVVRYCDGRRLRRHWQSDTATPNPQPVLRKGGVYCVTGGMGGLGVLVAADLLRRGQGVKVVLIGRRALAGEALAQFESLQTLAATRPGAAIEYRSVDIADSRAVWGLVAEIVRVHGHLHGIVHAAGVLRDGRISGKTLDDVRDVMAPKVLGTINLDEATRSQALDFFVLFASFAGVFGNAGQADYAAANGFQDWFALARNRRVAAGQAHGRTLAIDWPLWQDGGMRIQAEKEESILRTTGLVPLRTATGLDALFDSLASSADQCLVLEGNAERMQAWLAQSLHPVRHRPTRALDPATVGALREATQRQLVRLFAEATERSADQIDPFDPMENYGLDSIIVNKLNASLTDVFPGLSKTVFFEFRTLAALSEHLLSRQSDACRVWTASPGMADPADAAAEQPTVTIPLVPVAMQAPVASVAATKPVAAPRADREPIAIVGVSGMYPKAPDLDAYWRNLCAGRDCIGEIPTERWSLDGFFEPEPERAIEQGKSYSRWGGFLDRFAEFDSLFFNISPREAMNLDPQERLFLQECWRTLESAGYTREDLKTRFGGRVGVFAGITKAGYQLYAMHPTRDGEPFLPYTSFSSAANRVSYYLDISGPSMPVDTMCSSSLTAIHEACEHLLRDECTLAFAGGVNLYLHPITYTWLCSHNMLSSDGRCRSFGAGGDGYVPGEGVGAVLLKRLSDAERDGDPIHGVILATQVNHGGRTHGYTVPNPNAQAALIRGAIQAAGIDPRAISYIETHGTGTELGDPIEITGLQQAFDIPPGDDYRCRIGAVKSNIGHLESASGIAGLTKVLLQMRHGQLAPSLLHADTLNPNIDWARSPFVVNTQLEPWHAGGRPRIAGVSSFGASGANAHVLVQEYHGRVPVPQPAKRTEPVLVPLSAKTAAQLAQRARDLIAFIRDAAVAPDLEALAYTLQVGREAMEERFCCLVRSLDELVDVLQAFVDGRSGGEHVHVGQVAAHRDAMRVFTRDDDFRETVQRWIARRKLDRLAEMWSRGLDIDWHGMYGADRPVRLALPTYPFARDRLWVDTRVLAAPRAGATSGVLHPLLHRNVSDFHRQAYASVLDGSEPWLRDHVVGGERILPGVAYLEMVRAAMARALPGDDAGRVLELRNTVWAQPLVVAAPRPVEIVLEPQAESDRIAFAIASSDMPAQGEACVDPGARLLHCQGEAAFVQAAAETRVDLVRLEARMDRAAMDGDAIYRLFDGAGVKFGPSHRGVQRVAVGAGEVLARLRLPDAVSPADPAYVLHPSLMDSALQACGCLAASALGVGSDIAGTPLLPFALDELRVLAPCDAEMAAWVRLASGGDTPGATLVFDIDVLDAHGRPCVQMRGFSARAAGGAATARAQTHALVPVWNRVEPAPGELPAPQRLAVVGHAAAVAWARRTFPEAIALDVVSADARAALAERLRSDADHVLWVAPDAFDAEPSDTVDAAAALASLQEVFGLVKAALHLHRVPRWTFVTRQTQAAFPGDPVAPQQAGIAGFVGSLSREYPEWDIRLIDVASLDALTARDCVGLAGETPATVLVHRDGEWFRRGLATLAAMPAAPAGYREGGTYVVVGGAGGIGEAWSREMIERYDARIIWIGRRPLNDEIAAKIAALGRHGRAPEYISADATDPEALRKAAERIRITHPAIHGVVHSAIDLRDQSLAQMDAAELERAVAAKMAVAINLDDVFGAQDLDFVLFFSSMISFTTGAGQANYSAGSTFADGFALALAQRRPYPVKIMNWGYWGGVGVVADPFHQERMRQMGIGSIEAPEAMAALQTLVDTPGLSQMAVIKTLQPQALSAFVQPERVGGRPRQAVSSLPAAVDAARAALAVPSEAALRHDLPGDEVDALSIDLLVSALAGLGITGTDTFEQAVARVHPAHARWLETSLGIARTHAGAVRTWDALWAAWDARRAAWLENPRRRAQVLLLESCLRALPEILSGKRAATDVIFPNASMEHVQGVYQGHALADFCNDAVGEMLVAWLRALPSDAKIRILEIGAGTGGTTRNLLPRLAPFGERVAEYCYTDLSKAFLIHAETQFRALCPALNPKIFDVSRAPSEQGIEAGRYDVVVATNVLHATPDIRRTLRHAKAVLRPGGIVLINEMTGWSLARHLIFGLLEGWWLYEDEALREPGSPGLAIDTWRRLLAREGFDDVSLVVPEAHAFGQLVVTAASDGFWRQRVSSTPVTAPAAAPVAAPAPLPRVAPVAAPAAMQAGEASLHDRCTAYLKRAVAGVLKLDESRVGLTQPLADYGLDSILVIGLTGQLRKAFPAIGSTLFFEARNLNDLADTLLRNYPEQARRLFGGDTAGQGTAPVVPATAPVAAVQAGGASLHDRCTAYLKRAVAGVLRLDESRVGLTQPLADYGLDSILVIGLTGQLRKAFPAIGSTLFFEARNLDDLADTLLRNYPEQAQRLFGDDAAGQGAAPVAAAAPSRALRLSSPSSPAAVAPVAAHAAPAVEARLPADVAPFDVAIIGLSGRYPMANDMETFWDNLAQGRHCVGEVPADRWNWRDFDSDDADAPGAIYTRWGGFLDRIDQFDPLFFRISPKDAKAIDPQERLFLQAVYHAIEDAGYRPDALARPEKVGVFVGVMNARYTAQPLHYSIANRVSFALDFQGPSVAVDTACSSSLTAIHFALESLYGGQSDCAIAGGVNLIIDAGHYRELTAVGMLSHGDRCRAFGAGADGFIDAEGVGAAVLKPLAQAERDGDLIHGVIKASAINAGGRTHGYTVPNPVAQAAVVSEALRRARVSAADISCIEAHGTGTSLGDPIEVAGLRRAFEADTMERGYCAIGSLKSNFGHCESAAGIAALTKVLLQLRHGQLVPSLHADEVNPEIDFAQTPFRLQRTLQPWTRLRREIDGQVREVPRMAGISSFGAGGANAHLIVQEYVPSPVRRPAAAGTGRGPVVVPLSARTADQLVQKARDLLAFLERAAQRGETVSLASLAHTAQTGREERDERLAIVADSIDALVVALRRAAAGETGDGLHRGRAGRDAAAPADVPADGDATSIAHAWVSGHAIDWTRLHADGTPERMRLPGYPFAQDAYWQPVARVQVAPVSPAAAAPAKPARLHPLLHRNVSSLAGAAYEASFDASDVLVTAHRLDAGRFHGLTVPAAVHLVMVRAAIADAVHGDASATAAAFELAETTWAAPDVFDAALTLRVALLPRANGAIGYEIGRPAKDGQGAVLCQGLARPLRGDIEPPRIDLGAVSARLPSARWDADAFYRARGEAGLSYGPAYRSLVDVRSSASEVLAELCLPAGDAMPGLHPVLLDGAMQAASLLLPVALPPSLPWRLASMQSFRDCPARVHAWVRRAPAGAMQGLDIDLCDADGRICVQLRGLNHGAIELDDASPTQAPVQASTAEAPAVPAAAIVHSPAPAVPVQAASVGKADAAKAAGTVRLAMPEHVEVPAVQEASTRKAPTITLAPADAEPSPTPAGERKVKLALPDAVGVDEAAIVRPPRVVLSLDL